MNKRDFKKQHKNYYERLCLKHYVEWLNLYKREKRLIREQKQGKHKYCYFCIGITDYYIHLWKPYFKKNKHCSNFVGVLQYKNN